MNPFVCTCTDHHSDTTTSSRLSFSQIKEKLKVCMHNVTSTTDTEAQMLAQIKSLPEGEMKSALLDTYIKTVKKGPGFKKPPLFLEASYEKNTKTYMKFNREPKLQELSLSDVAADISLVKKDVAALKNQMESLQHEIEHAYPIDSWAR